MFPHRHPVISSGNQLAWPFWVKLAVALYEKVPALVPPWNEPHTPAGHACETHSASGPAAGNTCETPSRAFHAKATRAQTGAAASHCANVPQVRRHCPTSRAAQSVMHPEKKKTGAVAARNGAFGAESRSSVVSRYETSGQSAAAMGLCPRYWRPRVAVCIAALESWLLVRQHRMISATDASVVKTSPDRWSRRRSPSTVQDSVSDIGGVCLGEKTKNTHTHTHCSRHWGGAVVGPLVPSASNRSRCPRSC